MRKDDRGAADLRSETPIEPAVSLGDRLPTRQSRSSRRHVLGKRSSSRVLTPRVEAGGVCPHMGCGDAAIFSVGVNRNPVLARKIERPTEAFQTARQLSSPGSQTRRPATRYVFPLAVCQSKSALQKLRARFPRAKNDPIKARRFRGTPGFHAPMIRPLQAGSSGRVRRLFLRSGSRPWWRSR